jgi:hypothetical protein
MKTFLQYLKEGLLNKKYTFRVKVAGDFTTEQETNLKSLLDKFTVDSFKKIGTTPVQALQTCASNDTLRCAKSHGLQPGAGSSPSSLLEQLWQTPETGYHPCPNCS